MKKFLLSFALAAAACVAGGFTAQAAETFYTCLFGTSYNSKKVSTYTETWETTVDGNTFEIKNFNNNNNLWSYVKCGRKGNASVASISTKFPIEKSIENVTATIDAITSEKVNSIKLETSEDANFSSIISTVVAENLVKGDLVLALPSPAKNLYYRLTFDCQSHKSNGIVSVSKVTYNGFDSEAVDANASFEDIEVEVGQSVAPVFTPDDIPGVTYTSGDETIAKIENGKVVGVAQGTTTITASWAESKYFAGSATFRATVIKARQDSEIAFEYEHVDGKINTGIVWRSAIVTAGDGAVTYTSSNPDVVTINPTTGAITPDDVHKTGIALITATIAATENFREAKATYEAHILDPDKESDAVEFDLTTKRDNTYLSFHEAVGPGGIIKVKFEGGSFRLWDDGIRFYTGTTTLTFTSEPGYTITKIAAVGAGAMDLVGEFYKTGTQTWDGESSAVTLTLTPNETVALEGLNVFYKKEESTLKPAELTFTPRVNAVMVGEVAHLNGANNPNGRVLSYSIACLEDGDYIIETTENGIDVLVDKVGSYTLRAESEKDAEYMGGLAIMRLNVYPDIAPFADKANACDKKNKVIELVGGKVIVDFNMPNDFILLYKYTAKGADAVSEDFQPYANGDGIELTEEGTLSYYMQNGQGYDSEVVTYSVVNPAEIVGITHEVLAGKTVVRANYTLHVNNHREGNTYEVTFTVGGQTGTNTEHTLVTEEEAAVAPVAEDFTSTHKLKGTVVVTGLTGETDYKGSSLAVKVNGEDTASHTTEFDVKTGTVGIEDVTVDAAASAEYFTLQGVRVAQPEAGNIYIVRRGAEVSKELVK